MSEILLPVFSSRIFMVSGLTCKSLIHFEFIHVCSIRRWSSSIFLHATVQFSQHCLLNKLSLDHCMCFVPYQILTVKVWAYFWAHYSVPLIYMSVFMPVPCCFDYYGLIVQFDIRYHDSSNVVLLSQDRYCYVGLFVVPQKFLKYLFQFHKICHWNVDRNYVESVDCFGSYGYFNNVNSSYP